MTAPTSLKPGDPVKAGHEHKWVAGGEVVRCSVCGEALSADNCGSMFDMSACVEDREPGCEPEGVDPIKAGTFPPEFGTHAAHRRMLVALGVSGIELDRKMDEAIRQGERFGCGWREPRSVNAPVERHTRKMREMEANRAALPKPPAYAREKVEAPGSWRFDEPPEGVTLNDADEWVAAGRPVTWPTLHGAAERERSLFRAMSAAWREVEALELKKWHRKRSPTRLFAYHYWGALCQARSEPPNV